MLQGIRHTLDALVNSDLTGFYVDMNQGLPNMIEYLVDRGLELKTSEIQQFHDSASLADTNLVE